MNKRVIVWGTGNEAEILRDYLNTLSSWTDEIIAYCDNNRSKESFHGISVVSPDELEKIKPDLIVIATMYYDEIYDQIVREHPALCAIVVRRMIYESIAFAEDQYVKRSNKSNGVSLDRGKRITVYTAVTGQYDCLKDPEYVSDDIRYVCFTDDKNFQSRVWEKRLIESDMEDTLLSRHIKMFPEKYLEDTGVTIWVDAKYRIIGNLAEYSEKYWRGSGMLCFPHFKWKRMSDELEFLIKYRPQWEEAYRRQVTDYLNEGLPDEYDAFDCGCIVRHSDSKIVRSVMALWWDQLIKYSCPRDQIPFRYVLWKSGFKPDISDLYIEYNPYLMVSRV